MNTMQPRTPDPVVNGYGIGGCNDDYAAATDSYRGERFIMTSRQCRIARVIEGVRYDTVQATLIVELSEVDLGTGEYGSTTSLYRAHHGAYFLIRAEWFATPAISTKDSLRPISAAQVLRAAQSLIPAHDCLRFLRDWYFAGWLPRNDALVQSWAELILSANDSESVLAQFNGSLAVLA